jgi:hypothetical protein
MISVTQIRILAARGGHAVRQFRPDEASHQRDTAADQPRAQYQCRRVDALGDHIGVHEDPRANDAAHHQHGGVEQAKPLGQRLCRARVWLRRGIQFVSARTNLKRGKPGKDSKSANRFIYNLEFVMEALL